MYERGRGVKHISLFSGIGGFELAAKRVWGKDYEPVMFCEMDEFCQKVLEKHWPDVPIVPDVRMVGLGSKYTIAEVDLLTAGWPCQDNSNANQSETRLAGLAGERTGLWNELIRCIRIFRPKRGVLENVSNVLSVNNGEDWRACLRDLARIGYDAEWCCYTASMFGAPHHRERVFVVIYPNGNRLQEVESIHAHVQKAKVIKRQRRNIAGATCMVGNWWLSKSPLAGVDYGLRGELDEIKALGNAIVPQVAEQIFRAIKERDERL